VEENVGKITSKILEDAQAKSGEIIGQAESEAQEKLHTAMRKGEAAKEKLITDAQKMADLTRKKIVAEGKIKARTVLLESKEKLIRAAFEEAEKELGKLHEDPGYPDILKKLVTDTCVRMGGGELVIVVRKEDEKTVLKDLKKIEKEVKSINKSASLKIETENIGPGAIVRRGDGRVEIDSTFGNRLELLRPELRLKVAEALFK
jgi:vacuolar-type H+-ATPase subunit E/Vma4